MTNNTQIEINIIFGRYDQTAIKGFNKDLTVTTGSFAKLRAVARKFLANLRFTTSNFAQRRVVTNKSLLKPWPDLP